MRLDGGTCGDPWQEGVTVSEENPRATNTTTMRELRAYLEQAFSPAAADGLDAVFRLVVGDEELRFQVREQALTFGGAAPDVTVYFDRACTATGLLSGELDAMDTFMQGRFRADGYLMWAFLLIRLFRPELAHEG